MQETDGLELEPEAAVHDSQEASSAQPGVVHNQYHDPAAEQKLVSVWLATLLPEHLLRPVVASLCLLHLLV